MEYRDLGETGLKVSHIGMGCVTFGREIDRDMSFRILDHAFELGINFFDTAAGYADGASERVMGEWIESRGIRAEIVLATKVGPPLDPQRVVASTRHSLDRLCTDRVDLFQLHNWDDGTPLEETLEALTELSDGELVDHVGCSNFLTWQLAKGLLLSERRGLAPLRTVQPPYNLVQREIESELLPFCDDQRVGVVAYSPLGAGFLTGKYQRGQSVPVGTRFDVIPSHQPIYFTDHGYNILDMVEQLAQQANVSTIELALAWVLARQRISSVLIGARTPAHVDQACRAVTLQVDDLCAKLDEQTHV